MYVHTHLPLFLAFSSSSSILSSLETTSWPSVSIFGRSGGCSYRFGSISRTGIGLGLGLGIDFWGSPTLTELSRIKLVCEEITIRENKHKPDGRIFCWFALLLTHRWQAIGVYRTRYVLILESRLIKQLKRNLLSNIHRPLRMAATRTRTEEHSPSQLESSRYSEAPIWRVVENSSIIG